MSEARARAASALARVVAEAVRKTAPDEFASKHGLEMTVENPKWIIRKPA